MASFPTRWGRRRPDVRPTSPARASGRRPARFPAGSWPLSRHPARMRGPGGRAEPGRRRRRARRLRRRPQGRGRGYPHAGARRSAKYSRTCRWFGRLGRFDAQPDIPLCGMLGVETPAPASGSLQREEREVRPHWLPDLDVPRTVQQVGEAVHVSPPVVAMDLYVDQIGPGSPRLVDHEPRWVLRVPVEHRAHERPLVPHGIEHRPQELEKLPLAALLHLDRHYHCDGFVLPSRPTGAGGFRVEGGGSGTGEHHGSQHLTPLQLHRDLLDDRLSGESALSGGEEITCEVNDTSAAAMPHPLEQAEIFPRRSSDAFTLSVRKRSRMAMGMKLVRSLVCAFLCMLTTGTTAALELPDEWPSIAATSAGERISFPTSNPFTIAEVGNAPSNEARATYFAPEGASAAVPAPAVILLHGASGVKSTRSLTYARQFASMGIAALVIDAFASRRDLATSFTDRLVEITEAMLLAD